jgi:hypothetical protein
MEPYYDLISPLFNCHQHANTKAIVEHAEDIRHSDCLNSVLDILCLSCIPPLDNKHCYHSLYTACVLLHSVRFTSTM